MRKVYSDFSHGSKMNSSPLNKHLSEAWNVTINGQKIRRFNFIASLFDTVILSLTLIYQIGILWLDIMKKSSSFFEILRDFFLDLLGKNWFWLISWVIVFWALYYLTTFLVKNIFNAGLIFLIRAYNNKNEREYRSMPALTFWWNKSIKLVEYNSLLFWSKPVYIFYIFFWGYRFLDGNWTIIITLAIIFLVFLFLTRLFFEYSKYFIIVKDSGVFQSLWQSLIMTLENLWITFKIILSLVLVYLREIVLIISIFLLPWVLSWIISMGLATFYLQWVFVIIWLVYLIFLIIVSAMNSVIEIFVESLWYATFRENLNENTSSSE